ncbi:hypothetical protein BCR34DRAFT_575855 [Clohesyomyces aquaticus]|uniref:Uncharacterized protein n=1 Tax=Clohesyomyces aquaticus TaxID=1231657 RepID=A0A1Y1YQI1_9PLEO|nr:hypothetical protein BCR34DRAFT_575855 [Clohesyomyces aquaticus]
MKFSQTASLLALISALTTTAYADALSSKKNFYLITCVDKYEGDYDAIAYYADGPQPKALDWPEKVGKVSSTVSSWEGKTREAKIYNDNWFKAKIAKGADTLKTGDIAGTGDFEGEPFVCFKEAGTILYSASDITCKQKYWCPSVSVSKPSTVRRAFRA